MAVIKVLLGGIIIWLVSELGKRSGKVGGLVLSLPVTSIVALLWLWFETHDSSKVADVSKETLVFIIPSLIFFIALPILLQRSINFYVSFALAVSFTLGSYFIFYKFRGEI
jgi:uncharacterized membrane protein (GlpM family)